MSDLRDIAALAWWLGPWSAGRTPAGSTAEEHWLEVEGRRVRLRLHVPDRAISGAYLLAPGLHPLSGDHPELDRFARSLASAGALVAVPFVTDFQRLQLLPSAYPEFAAAFDALWADPRRPAGVRPGVWSVSVGSWLALRLAADPERATRVGAVAPYGGFGRWADTVRYAISGEVDGRKVLEPDVRTVPVLFLQMAPGLPVDDATRERLCAAWRAYIGETWLPGVGADPEPLRPVAEQLAAGFPTPTGSCSSRAVGSRRAPRRGSTPRSTRWTWPTSTPPRSASRACGVARS